MKINNAALVTNIGDITQTMSACVISCGVVILINTFILVKTMNNTPSNIYEGGEDDFEK